MRDSIWPLKINYNHMKKSAHFLFAVFHLNFSPIPRQWYLTKPFYELSMQMPLWEICQEIGITQNAGCHQTEKTPITSLSIQSSWQGADDDRQLLWHSSEMKDLKMQFQVKNDCWNWSARHQVRFHLKHSNCGLTIQFLFSLYWRNIPQQAKTRSIKLVNWEYASLILKEGE